jgi:hypothetical protein
MAVTGVARRMDHLNRGVPHGDPIAVSCLYRPVGGNLEGTAVELHEPALGRARRDPYDAGVGQDPGPLGWT